MDTRSKERQDEFPTVETPEDVAVLYSWANLHGAKYRDFSASRREYRAQLRHRAAEQAREQELRAQADAEASAREAERAAREAERAAAMSQAEESEAERHEAMRQSEAAARVAAAERIEAARRAEAAAQAEAQAERERREMLEAKESARRQAAQYADSEVRRRQMLEARQDAELPGMISDPYTPQLRTIVAEPESVEVSMAVELRPTRYRSAPEPAGWERDHMTDSEQGRREQPRGQEREGQQRRYEETDPAAVGVTRSELARAEAAGFDGEIESDDRPYTAHFYEEPAPMPEAALPPRRPQGYRPDDASGVREIYRGPASEGASSPARQLIPAAPRMQPERHPYSGAPAQPISVTGSAAPARIPDPGHRRTIWAGSTPEQRPAAQSERVIARTPQQGLVPPTAVSQPSVGTPGPDATPRRRRQDLMPTSRPDMRTDGQLSGAGEVTRAGEAAERYRPATSVNRPTTGAPIAPSWQAAPPAGAAPLPQRLAAPAEPVAPAWLHAVPGSEETVIAPGPATSSVADTLQYSRERVASRWYALKGVFEQPGQELPEPQRVRQKEVRTPVLAVFSLAGGVGKTSLVATLGRALSSMGEKVLLTDTTSHGLLPFYFGASELRQGTVRTFSPPSGSTDAPIYLVSYDVDGRANEEAQKALVEEITASGRGTHRLLLDMSLMSSWLLHRMAHLNPTILVPVAPDMNSVISLQSVEKFFQGMTDGEGASAKVFYVLNQFDASLPLHLDVREVLRRQLGERLLPFVIRRAPAVSESLAEGMTIIDYSPEAPVAEDYLNVATWLRSQAAPATAGFRNVRWSER